MALAREAQHAKAAVGRRRGIASTVQRAVAAAAPPPGRALQQRLGNHGTQALIARQLQPVQRKAKLRGGGARAGGAAQAAGCTYDVHYAHQQSLKCDGGNCGAKIAYSVTGVTASGADCPATLNGLVLTERVRTDHGCGAGGGVETGIGCLITATAAEPHKGTFRARCGDTYELCGPAAELPATGCTEVYTQDIFVGGRPADKRLITFRISKSRGKCSGTATRTPARR